MWTRGNLGVGEWGLILLYWSLPWTTTNVESLKDQRGLQLFSSTRWFMLEKLDDNACNLRRTPWISQWKTTRSTKERLQRTYFQWLHRLKIHPDSSFSLHTSATALERAETAPPSERAWPHSRHDTDLNVGLVFLASVILHEKNMSSGTAPPLQPGSQPAPSRSWELLSWNTTEEVKLPSQTYSRWDKSSQLRTQACRRLLTVVNLWILGWIYYAALLRHYKSSQ